MSKIYRSLLAIIGLTFTLVCSGWAQSICPTADQLLPLTGYKLSQEIKKSVQSCAGTTNDTHGLTQEVYALIDEIDPSDVDSSVIIQSRIVAKLGEHMGTMQLPAENDDLTRQIEYLKQNLSEWEADPSKYLGEAEWWTWSNYQTLDEKIDYAIITSAGLDNPPQLSKQDLDMLIDMIRVINLSWATVRKDAAYRVKEQATALKSVRKQFDVYAKYARMRYPWELPGNDWIYRTWFDASDDKFNPPPRFQVNYLHPYAGYEFSDFSENGLNGIFLLDLLGFQILSWDGETTTKWPVGLSVFASYTIENSDNEFGGGIMAHVRSFSVGINVRNSEESNGDVIAVIGLDVGKAISSGKKKLDKVR